MRNTNTVVIERLKAEIEDRRLSRNHLAGKAGMNYGTLGRKLDGQTPLSLTEVDRLAGALDLTAIDLMTENQEKQS